MNTEVMLDDLATLRATLASWRETMDTLIDAAIPEDIKAEIAAIRAEYEPGITHLTQDIAGMEADIRNAVIRDGATVRGSSLVAVYSAGRVSWDDKGLNGYALAHPEITTFRKVGLPSVTIRAR